MTCRILKSRSCRERDNHNHSHHHHNHHDDNDDDNDDNDGHANGSDGRRWTDSRPGSGAPTLWPTGAFFSGSHSSRAHRRPPPACPGRQRWCSCVAYWPMDAPSMTGTTEDDSDESDETRRHSSRLGRTTTLVSFRTDDDGVEDGRLEEEGTRRTRRALCSSRLCSSCRHSTTLSSTKRDNIRRRHSSTSAIKAWDKTRREFSSRPALLHGSTPAVFVPPAG